jgi:hypothetical protein
MLKRFSFMQSDCAEKFWPHTKLKSGGVLAASPFERTSGGSMML